MLAALRSTMPQEFGDPTLRSDPLVEFVDGVGRIIPPFGLGMPGRAQPTVLVLDDADLLPVDGGNVDVVLRVFPESFGIGLVGHEKTPFCQNFHCRYLTAILTKRGFSAQQKLPPRGLEPLSPG